MGNNIIIKVFDRMSGKMLFLGIHTIISFLILHMGCIAEGALFRYNGLPSYHAYAVLRAWWIYKA